MVSKPNSARGTVLMSALSILLVLTLIFVAALTFGVARFTQVRKAKHRIIARYASETGVTRTVLALNRMSIDVTDTLGVTLENGAKFAATVKPWGGYLLIRSVGSYAHQEVVAMAQVGQQPPDILQAALTIGDGRYPLVLSHRSRILGDVNVGPLGVTSGAISGIGVTLDSALLGNVHRRTDLTVPALDSPATGWQEIFAVTPQSANQVLAGSQLWDGRKLSASALTGDILIDGHLQLTGQWSSDWYHIPQVVVSGVIDISGTAMLSGFAILASTTCIIVSDSARLDGILLAAEDSIIFEDHSRFSGIAISRGRIVVRDHAHSRFPTAFVTLPAVNSLQKSPGIALYTQGILEGICYVTAYGDDSTVTTGLLSSAPDITFCGDLISRGHADISGNVTGSLWIEQSRLVEGPSVYINWIRDLTIDRSRLLYDMPLPISADHQSPLTVVRLETQL